MNEALTANVEVEPNVLVRSKIMKVLIAEDDPVTRCQVEGMVRKWNFSPVTTDNGLDAWRALEADPEIHLAVTDWQMPGLNGEELCSKAKAELKDRPLYMIILTAAKIDKKDLVSGLTAGADDYLLKPYDTAELQARLRVGQRVIQLHQELQERVRELEEALAQIKQLRGLIPICSYCKKIRDDKNYWHQVDAYLSTHSDATFSHGICPTCSETILAELNQ